ncbi:MAG: hypothetical protein ABIG61_01250 [Planctomycetota bacterium]
MKRTGAILIVSIAVAASGLFLLGGCKTTDASKRCQQENARLKEQLAQLGEKNDNMSDMVDFIAEEHTKAMKEIDDCKRQINDLERRLQIQKNAASLKKETLEKGIAELKALRAHPNNP